MDDKKTDKERISKRLDSIVPDALKKAVAAGVGAVFLTEEGIRHVVSDMKLPKEALGYVLQQTDKTRKDAFRAVSREVKKYLRSPEMEQLLSRILQHFTVEIKAEIRFKTSEKGGIKVDIGSFEASPKREQEDDAEDEADDDEQA